MAVKLTETERARSLFGGWQEAIIWACLDGTMGDIYGDDPLAPRSAAAVLGDFCFLAGEPDQELLCFEREFMIAVPQNAGWAKAIEERFGESARAITRYAIRKEPAVFDEGRLHVFAASLGTGYELKRLDRECYFLCKEEAWSRDLVSQFPDYETFAALGLGAVVFKDGELVSGASTYARYRQGIEIEIDTREDQRRNGLACACGARLILDCLSYGIYPSWDAQNRASVALAEKLGYHFDREYLAYEICGAGR